MIEAGNVFWITGLSGAGKSSIGKALFHRLKASGESVFLLDGDKFREVMGNDLGHNTTDRIKNAYRISRMCRFVANQGITVVCATMSLYKEIHDWNRRNIDGYRQIYIRVKSEILLKRDQKGLYSNSLSGNVTNVVSLNLPFEEPLNNDLVVENNDPLENFDQIASKIQKYFLKLV